MVVSEDDANCAEDRMTERREGGFAVSARYDRRTGRVFVDLNTGVQVVFPTRLAEGLSGASPDKLADIEISPAGLGLHWPKLDADLYVPALLQGMLGSKPWMAAQRGNSSGPDRSDKMIAPARKSGRKADRPRKLGGG